MEITAQRIRERIAELEQLRETALANANAASGAIQDCRFWLALLEQRPEVEAKEAPTE